MNLGNVKVVVECEGCLLCIRILMRHSCTPKYKVMICSLGIYVCSHRAFRLWQPYSGFRGRAVCLIRCLCGPPSGSLLDLKTALLGKC